MEATGKSYIGRNIEESLLKASLPSEVGPQRAACSQSSKLMMSYEEDIKAQDDRTFLYFRGYSSWLQSG